MRLRAGLRIGGLLRVGRARPLGGGLFAGGGAAREVLTGRALLAGRHRLQAALVTATLLGAAGVGWAATRETPKVEEAQAAGAGPAAAAPEDTLCSVRYQLKRDSGREYEALLTVATTDEIGRGAWRVVFVYPGSQRLTTTPKAVSQKGRKVIARGRGTLRRFTLRGDYRGYNPLPLAFSLDGRRCRAEVMGGTTQPIGDTAGPSSGRSQPAHAVGGTAKRNRPPSKSSTPRKRVHRPQPAITSPAPAVPTLPTPMSRKGSGFSLAL